MVEQTFESVISGDAAQASSEPEATASTGEEAGGETAAAGQESEESQETASGDGAGEKESEGGAGESNGSAQQSDKTTLEKLTKKWAERAGLDPNNPKDAKTLKSLIDQDLYIAKLKGEQVDLGDEQGQTQDGSDGLTELERQAREEEEQEQQQQQTSTTDTKPEAKPTAGSASEPGKYGDIGDSWKTPADSYKAEAEAWAKYGETQDTRDLETVHKIALARFERMADAMVAPKVLGTLKPIADRLAQLEAKLGGILPRAEQDIRAARDRENSIAAKEQLAKVPGFESLPELFKPVDDKQIEFDGQKFANTLFNQICVAKPYILTISVSPQSAEAKLAAKKSGISPEEAADRLTYIARYRAVMDYHKAGQISPGKAKVLVQAGADAASRKKADMVRQQLNSGRSVSQNGSHRASAPDKEETLDDLFKK